MRERGNYFADIEKAAAEALAAGRLPRGALSQRALPASPRTSASPCTTSRTCRGPTRSVTDLRNRRIYLQQEQLGMHTPAHASCCRRSATSRSATPSRATSPTSCGSGSRPTTSPPRVLVPETAPRFLLQAAKADRALSIEDLRDVFAVSYEMAAHRFTNLATHHLELPVPLRPQRRERHDLQGVRERRHRVPRRRARRDRGPADVPAVVGRAQVFASADRFSVVPPVHRHARRAPTSAWRTSTRRGSGDFAVTLGVPFEQSRWFRGRDTRDRTKSRCPTRPAAPPAAAAGRALGGARLAVGPRPLARARRAAARARSPASTRPTSTRSWTGTRRSTDRDRLVLAGTGRRPGGH